MKHLSSWMFHNFKISRHNFSYFHHKTITPISYHIMVDLHNDPILYFISRNRRSRMNWRHRCLGFNTFEILYHEELVSMQRNHLSVSKFLIDIITMIYFQIYKSAKVKGIPIEKRVLSRVRGKMKKKNLK